MQRANSRSRARMLLVQSAPQRLRPLTTFYYTLLLRLLSEPAPATGWLGLTSSWLALTSSYSLKLCSVMLMPIFSLLSRPAFAVFSLISCQFGPILPADHKFSQLVFSASEAQSSIGWSNALLWTALLRVIPRAHDCP